MRPSQLLGILLLCSSVTACAGARQSGICGQIPPPPTAEGDANALEAAGDAAWPDRADTARLAEAVASWKQAVKVDPSRADLRIKLARAAYFYADGHLRFDETKQDLMLEHLKLATNEAELALGQNYQGFRSKYCSRQPYQAALQQLDKDAIPAMYWYATALGKYALATSIVEVLNQKDRIKAMMDTIRQLEPSFFYHAADRYLGAFFTKIPFPNGDLPLSRSHFEAAINGSPEYLASRTLFAEMYAIKAKDRATFKAQLDAVLAFDLDSAPDIRPENQVEQRKARDLLEEIDIFFPED